MFVNYDESIQYGGKEEVYYVVHVFTARTCVLVYVLIVGNTRVGVLCRTETKKKKDITFFLRFYTRQKKIGTNLFFRFEF